jgi:enoyl-CoA hydratase/carnithine racemase
MSEPTIRLDVADKVAVITLDRPERLNAWNKQMATELFTALAELDADDAVRAIVVTGAGRAFCAGADLESRGETFAGGARPALQAAEARVRPWNMRTPVIAAINGPAVGIGATLPLWWDLRIASEQAKIGFVFTRRGIVPEANSTWILPRLVGFSRAMDLLLTGRMVPAAEALELGLVSRVVAHERLLDTAQEMAAEIAYKTAPVSVAVTRRLLWRQLMDADPRSAKRTEDAVFWWAGRQPDAAEGIVSFLEKRPPRWSMSPSGPLPDEVAELVDE